MTGLDFKQTLAATASVSTILQFLAGVLECQKYVRNGTTGDASSLAFITCFMSCSLWLLYGLLIEDLSVIVVNMFGSLIELIYVYIFMLYSLKKSLATKQLAAAVMSVVFISIYCHYEIDRDLARERIGLLSCGLTVVFFASPLTMLAHVLRVKSAESLPFTIILSSLIVSFQWLIYGYIIDDAYIEIPNFLGCVLSVFQLSLFVFYPGKHQDQVHLI